jgi:hypothetical protein
VTRGSAIIYANRTDLWPLTVPIGESEIGAVVQIQFAFGSKHGCYFISYGQRARRPPNSVPPMIKKVSSCEAENRLLRYTGSGTRVDF